MIYETKEASSSECSECKRENMVHADESSSEEEELVVPLRKAPKPKKNHPPPPDLEALHAEIAFLRRQNMQKDSLIADMKYHTRMVPEEEMERLRRQMSSPTRLVMASPPHGARTYPIPPRQEVGEPTATGDVTVLTLEKQVREQQIELMTLKQKLATVEAESDWLVRFAQTFVRMNQDLSKVYGERLHLKAMPLKRKTKLAWRYMKDLINTLIKE